MSSAPHPTIDQIPGPLDQPARFLFLYTELAPYVIACLRALAERGAEVHVVRWPVNREAPFRMEVDERIHLYERNTMGTDGLLQLAERIKPAVVLASGWVDKGYLAVCRTLRAAGVPTVMCSDTAWRGSARQWLAVGAGRFWIRSAFSHAWVTGTAQADYARKLGFADSDIRTGFYSADTDLFAPLATSLGAQRALAWPHRFLCTARYIPTKGHQYLCDAFAELCDADETEDWELWIVGTGELHEQVMRSPSGRHPRIRHLGFIQAEALPAIMADCGVFILPSTYEPWGVVVQENACAGFPLLLSDAVGAAERFLHEGENGHLFRAGDRSSIKQAMLRMVHANDDRLRAMGLRSASIGISWNPDQWAAVAMGLIR